MAMGDKRGEMGRGMMWGKGVLWVWMKRGVI